MNPLVSTIILLGTQLRTDNANALAFVIMKQNEKIFRKTFKQLILQRRKVHRLIYLYRDFVTL